MPLYKPAELREFLDSLNISPQRHLSQNFLIDKNIRDKILTLSGAKEGDWVIEIGPGPGVLTEALTEMGVKLITIEKDRTLAKEIARFPLIEAIEEDVLKVDFEELAQKYLQEGKKFKIVSNLPYHLSSPILANLFPLNESIESITVMLQKEFATRLTAKVGDKDYSSLTLLAKLYGEVDEGFKVSKHCFFPVPKVDSRVIRIDVKKPSYPKQELIPFNEFIRNCFQLRRKTLRALLKIQYPKQDAIEALRLAQIAETTRPETLSIEDFWRLYQALFSLKHEEGEG